MRQSGRWVRWLFVVATSACAAAQMQPPASAALSADLSRYYFKTPEEEVAARAELNDALGQTTQFKGQLNSGSQLLALLRQYDVVRTLFGRHEAYLHLRCALNRKDAACD